MHVLYVYVCSRLFLPTLSQMSPRTDSLGRFWDAAKCWYIFTGSNVYLVMEGQAV